MHLKKLLFFFSLFLSSVTFSQTYELGKVTLSELEEATYPKDTTVAAAVLFQIGKSYFDFSPGKGFELVTETDIKIKIYNQDGVVFAKQNIEYYKGDTGAESVMISKVVSYTLVDEEMIKTNLNGQDIPTEEKSKHWTVKKMVIPNVKVGSIIEYRIVTRSPFVSSFPEWSFQKSIPVNHSEYTTVIPDYYIYNVKYKGNVPPTKTVTKGQKTITIDEREKAKPGSVFFGASGNPTINYAETKTVYKMDDVPALEDESFVNNIDNYRIGVTHQLTQIKMQTGAIQSFETDWASVVKKIYDAEDFSGELNKTGYFEKDLNIYLRGVIGQDNKLKEVFNFVKKRMNWNEVSSTSCDRDIVEAYGGATTGNSAEINLMLTAALRYAGFDANPVLISTRTHGIANYPTPAAFNHVIVAVEFAGNRILLDATSKHALPNILPINSLNGKGRLVKKDGSSIEISTLPKAKAKEIIKVVAQITQDGNVIGKTTDQYFDYNAFTFREKNNKQSHDVWVNELENRFEGIEIEDYIFINSISLPLPIEESYSFQDTNSAQLDENRISFSPALFFASAPNPFTKDSRTYPADFVYPQRDEYSILINIPEGYGISSVPESKSLTMPNNLGSFNYTVSRNGNQVQLLMDLDFNQAVIEASNYYVLKNFYKEMYEKQNEKVILVKL
ncbi:MAG: DUF3857 domain-containing protein [Bacteroidota bacterium]